MSSAIEPQTNTTTGLKHTPSQRGGRVGQAHVLAQIGRSEWVKVAAVVALFVWYPLATLKNPLVDPDIWWHMATGEWILRHHAVPRSDPFSIGGAAKHWVAYSWLFEVAAYWVGKTWDLAGIAIFRVLVWLAAIGAFFAWMRKVASDFWRAALLTFVGSYTMARVFGPRPGAFSVLFFTILFYVLWDTERNGTTKKLWGAPVLFCVWANVHAQFVYGLFVLGLFCVEPALNRAARQAWLGEPQSTANRRLWLIFALSAAATLVNPYGWGVYKVVFTYGQQVWATRYIIENGPLPFNQLSDYLALLLTLGAAFALGTSRRVRPLYVVLLLWGAVSAFRTQRDIWVLAIVACGILGERVRVETDDIMGRRGGLLATAAVMVILLAGWRFAPGNKELLSYAALRLPVGAVGYIHEHRLRGPIFNNFDWGGFLIYALPGEPVAIDGRTNVHGSEEMKRSFETWNGMPGWETDPLLQRANVVVASPAFALTQLLRMDPEFRVVFDDHVSVVFERTALVEQRVKSQ